MSTRRPVYLAESIEPPLAELQHLRRLSRAERPDPSLRGEVRRRLLANLDKTSHPPRRHRRAVVVLFKAFLVPFSATVVVSSALAATTQGERLLLEVRKVLASVVNVPAPPEEVAAPSPRKKSRRVPRDAEKSVVSPFENGMVDAVASAVDAVASAVDAVVTVEPSASAAESQSLPPFSNTVDEASPSALTRPKGNTPEASVLTPGTTLAAERHLLQVARLALARGETQGVLEAVALYESRFPRGVLAREARELAARARELDAVMNERR